MTAHRVIATAVAMALLALCFFIPTAFQGQAQSQAQASEQALAQEPKDIRTVRVGYYDSRNFLVGAAESNAKSGYGYEYLQRIASYANWHYDYVYGTWSELYEKLKSGQIDILPGVSDTPAHENEVSFPSLSMLNETFYIYSHAADGYRIGSGAAAWNGKRIGYAANTNSEAAFKTWIESSNCTATSVSYRSFSELKEAFEKGRIDGLVSSDNVAYTMKDIVPIEIIGKVPYYLAVSKSSKGTLKELNEAQALIASQDKNFIDSLQSRYATDSSLNVYLTADEAKWMDEHQKVTIGYLNDYLPYCDTGVDGNARGLMTDVFSAIVDNLPGKWCPEVNYRAFDDQSELFEALTSGDVDVVFPAGGESWYAEECGFMCGSPVVSSAMEMVYRPKSSFKEASASIAVNKHNLLQLNYAQTNYPNSTIVECGSITECLKTVDEGRAGSTIINGLRSGVLSDAADNYIRVQMPKPDDRCFGVATGNSTLLQLLNRGIYIIGESYGANASYLYSEELYSYTVFDLIKDNLAAFIALVILVIALIAALIILRFKKMRQLAEQEAAQNAALESALAKAEQASRGKDILLRNLSHDIRTPLNGILGAMSINSTSTDKRAMQANVEKAQLAAKQLLHLVDDLLEMTKLKSGDVEVGHEPFSLEELIDETVADAEPQAKFSGIALDYRKLPGKNGTWALGSPTYLRQILINLLDNAIRYNKTGGKVIVDCSLEDAGKGKARLACSIEDTGIGMSEQMLEKAFEPFMQADCDDARSVYPGSGLGLSIAKALVELMGGSISLASEQGEGTRVEFSLPIELTSPAMGSKHGDNDVMREGGLKGMCCLLVEDNELNLEITQHALESAGATVITARNGEQAVKAFNTSINNGIDVILMDIMMPVMNGHDAARAIRALERPDAQTVPIIAMTANAFEEDRIRSFEAGMDMHLSKPVDLKELITVLAAYQGSPSPEGR